MPEGKKAFLTGFLNYPSFPQHYIQCSAVSTCLSFPSYILHTWHPHSKLKNYLYIIQNIYSFNIVHDYFSSIYRNIFWIIVAYD